MDLGGSGSPKSHTLYLKIDGNGRRSGFLLGCYFFQVLCMLVSGSVVHTPLSHYQVSGTC